MQIIIPIPGGEIGKLHNIFGLNENSLLGRLNLHISDFLTHAVKLPVF